MNLKRMNSMHLGEWLDVFFASLRPAFDQYVFMRTAKVVSIGTGYGSMLKADPAVDVDALWNSVVQEEKLRLLADILKRLPLRKRQVVLAYLSRDFQTNTEVGKMMGITHSCVSKYYQQAQKTLGEELGSRAVKSLS